MRMLILSLALVSSGYAQTGDILAQARELSSNDHSQQAIALLNEHLKVSPDDSDARVLLGLICSWNKRYEEGRNAFSIVLKSDSDYKDAVLGLIHLELWSGNARRATELAKNAVASRPMDPDYKVELAKAQADLTAARVILPSAQGNPTPAYDGPNWEAGVAESNIFYSDKRSSWHETAVDISRHFTAGWVTATFSHANWFGEGSNLIDLQSYPSIRPGTYAFLDAAFSPDATLYAHHRFGGEIFQSLPRGFEASAGVRYMRFGSNTLLYTGSVGKWFGNYWVLGRTFIDPDPVVGTSTSFQVSFRKYYDDADKFIGLRLGEGASPFEVQSTNDLGVQRSASAAFESLWKFRNKYRMRASVSVARQTRLYIGPLWQYEADCTFYFRY